MANNYRAQFYCVPTIGSFGPASEIEDFSAVSHAAALRRAKASVLPPTGNCGDRVRIVSIVQFLGKIGDYENINIVK